MRNKKKHTLSFYNKIVITTIIIVLFSALTVGLFSHVVAQNELNQSGQTVLKNGVVQAKNLISSYHAQVESGYLDENEAIEAIKETLIGPMTSDGSRLRTSEIDLGKLGYFIIYDRAGNEIMHPTIEGQNVWNVKDFSDDQVLLVQEQIQLALDGGGFLYYDWTFPNSDEVGGKISYGEYSEAWDWIVVATAYELDFNAAANKILLVNMLTLFVVLLISWFIITKYIRGLTKPLLKITNGMENVALGKYETIDVFSTSSEIKLLGDGYNHMITTLNQTRKDLSVQNEKIRYLAYHDELTGLSNRYGLTEFLSNSLSTCKKGFLVQIDIMGMNVINTVLGYLQGDRILSLIAQYFNEIDENNLVVARTSSNEFTIWIEDSSLNETIKLLEKMRNELKKHIIDKGYNQVIEMYIALSSYPTQGETFDELYEQTSVAMKVAKDNGDLRICFYEPSMKVAIENELLMGNHLHRAIREGEISAYYQGKVDYQTKKVVGVEALARWKSDELGFIPPNIFIPAITKLNLISEFGSYMIDKVFNDYKSIQNKYGKEVSVSINISPAHFMDPNFYDQLKEMINQYQISPEKVILEITEDLFISDYDGIAEIITKVHNLGVRVSIDDFGTGYSSLNYLTNMNFDEMKIDKSFIDQILDDDKVFKLFQILCNIAEVYGYDIVAEGVETEKQLEKIKETSLKVIQGYLFSKPEPL